MLWPLNMFVAFVVFHFVDELLDVLFLAARTDQQHVLRIHHDVLLQAVDDGYFAFREGDDAAAGIFVRIASLLGFGVGVTVLAGVLVERAPGTHVAPAELSAAYIDVVRLLHHAVVDRDGAAFGEYPGDGFRFFRSAQYRLDVREEGVVLGQVGAHRFDDVADFPDEDAGVPEKFAALQERLRQLQVGFFGETLDLADGPVVRYLDIAVARFRTGGLDADGHQSRPVVDEVEAFADDGAEILLVEDQVIRRGDDHLRSRIALLQSVGCITDAGSRVASDGFAEYLFRPEFRDLFQHEVFVAGVGHDQEIFSRSQFFETLVRHAYKRLAGAEDIEELLGLGLAAFGPEAAADAAGHDDAIGMFVHDELSLRFVFE